MSPPTPASGPSPRRISAEGEAALQFKRDYSNLTGRLSGLATLQIGAQSLPTIDRYVRQFQISGQKTIISTAALSFHLAGLAHLFSCDVLGPLGLVAPRLRSFSCTYADHYWDTNLPNTFVAMFAPQGQGAVSLPLRARDLHVPFVDSPPADGSAAPEQHLVMLDTGAQITVISASLVDSQPNRFHQLWGSVFAPEDLTINIGPLSFHPERILRGDLPDSIEKNNLRSQKLGAIVGLDFLGQHPFDIDVASGLITFGVDVAQTVSSGSWTAIPYNWNSKFMIFGAMFNGKPSAFIFDTGVQETHVSQKCAEARGVAIDPKGSQQVVHNGNSGGSDLPIVQLPSVDAIAYRPAEDGTIEASPIPIPSHSAVVVPNDDPLAHVFNKHSVCGAIGPAIFLHYRVVHDPLTHVLYVQRYDK